jgi:molybdopterin-containing oxidoreductase family membrane subunit
MATIHSNPEALRMVDNTTDDPLVRAPLVLGGKGFTEVTEAVAGIPQRKTPLGWYIAFVISLGLLGLLGLTLGYLVTAGVGVWGNNQPVSWAFDIINFVFWVGIGHAGTLISAILFLLRQNWRTSINRFAEAMTIFAVICAALFPGVHVGRPWLAYWLFPLPNQMDMWPQFRSPLLWDVFAVGTYATVSALFWYIGMIPDLATLRDRAKSRTAQIAYGIAALGWTGSSRHWHRFEKAYLLLAALATPLVLSVHSVVSFDFATSQLPGWHTTIFPPYFVAGAVFGGFAMVITLAIPSREFFGLKDLITMRHLENMAKVMLGTGLIVGYAYGVEFFMAWYSGQHYERFVFLNRAGGPYKWAFWTMVFCNIVAPQFLWSKKLRTNLLALFIVAMCVNVGMWFERFVIIVTSLHRDFLPSSWAMYKPTWVDLGMLAGSFGLFFTLFLLFCRFLPMVAMAEVKTVMPQAHLHGGHEGRTRLDERRSDYYPDEDYRPEEDEDEGDGNGRGDRPGRT